MILRALLLKRHFRIRFAKKGEISIFMSVKSSKIVMNRRSLTDLL